MQKNWEKTGINIKMVGPDHEQGIRRNFVNVAQTVSTEQVQKLAGILETISNDHFVEANVVTTEKIVVGK